MIPLVSDAPSEVAARRGIFERLRRPPPTDGADPKDSQLASDTTDGGDAAGSDESAPDESQAPEPAPPDEDDLTAQSGPAEDAATETVTPDEPGPPADLRPPSGAGETASDDGTGELGPLPGAEALEAVQRQDARTLEASADSGRFARPLPRVIAVANQKGGVGKTTTTVNLSACLAELGFRVLIVDLDPQGNASTGVGINIRDLATSMYDVLLHDAPMEDCVEATSVRNLYVAPANLDLAGAEIELVPAFSRELRLKNALNSVRDDYDYILIDCPPSLGLLTVNSLAAATEVLVPIQCEYYALEGLGQLLRNVGLVQKNLNPSLEVSAILCVMYDARTKLADQVVSEVRTHFGEKVCRTVVPRTVRLSEAPSFGQPISAFDPSSRGAIAYKEVAKEVSGGTA